MSQRQAKARRRKVLAADLFCGAGGFTTALVRELDAMGLDCELVVVNHNPVAIATIAKNHPKARHYIEDLHLADPERLVPEGRLDILLASPTCTYHSRARGGKPTSDQQRMDPMVVLAWCTKLRIGRLVVENVPEFVDWGPIDSRTGKPVRSRRGEYFRAWVAALEAIGYRVEWRIITAADHGDATTRSRFFLMARSERKAIPWPDPTHSQSGVADLFGTRKKWRAAREIIDWSDRGSSIFGRPVPLKPNTLRRIRAGAAKFSGPWAEVFRAAVDEELCRSILYHDAGINRKLAKNRGQTKKKPKPVWLYDARTNSSHLVPAGGRGYTGDTWSPWTDTTPQMCFVTRDDCIERSSAPIAAETDYLVVLRGTGGARSSHLPIPGITAGGTHLGIARPFIFQVNQGNGRYGSHRSADEPLYTVLTRDSYGMVDLSIDRFAAFTNGNRSNNVARGIGEPIATTVTATGGGIFVARPRAFIFAQGSTGAPQLAEMAPVPAITTVARIQLIEPIVSPFVLGQHGGSVPRDVRWPLPTIVQGGAISLVQPFILNRHGDHAGPPRAGHSINDPFPTVTRSGGGYLIDPFLAVMKGQSYCASIEAPIPAVTTRRHLAVIDPFLITVNHVGSARRPENRHQLISAPLPTLTSKRGFAFASPFLTPYYGGNTYRGGLHAIGSPLPTVTTKDRFALVQPFLVPFFGERPTQAPRFHVVDEPLPAVTSHGAGGLIQPWLVQIDQGGSWGPCVRPIDQPIGTLVTKQNIALAEPFVICTRHSRAGGGPAPRSVDSPLPTITATGHGEFSVVQATSDNDSGLLVWVDGTACIVDILFRMLRNPELAAAMSFSGEDYSYEFSGTETEITKQIGNAVPVRTARALVRASLSDLVRVAKLPARKRAAA